MSRDRDRILEQALKHELKGAGTPPAGACLDAETLGAWADGGLDPATVAACEAHVANCARCQALVGTLARSIPVSTENTLGTLGTLGTPGTLSWKWWLAPIAAGVAATTLWMVVPEQPQLAVAPAEKQTKLADEQPAAALDFAQGKPQAPPPAAPSAALEQNLERERTEARDNLAAATRADRAQRRDAAPPKEEEAKRFADSAAGQRQEAAPAATPAPAAPAPPPATAALEAPAAGLQKSMRATIAPIEIQTLDPALGWRIVGDRIERSGDGGKTWTLMLQSRGDRIVAGAAPSNSVCWFVGAAGRVLLTVNAGTTFVDVSLAEPLDLTSVAAIDARNATVFAVTGRRFRTDDGGRTWRSF